MAEDLDVIKVNINSYVTLDEADTYVRENYLSSSPEYVNWLGDNVKNTDKMAALISSAKVLNRYKYKGAKVIYGQPLAFPRRDIAYPGLVPLLFRSQTYDNTLIDSTYGSDGLELAKEAQIVNAVAMLSVNQSLVTEVRERRFSGIVSEKVGSVSRAYDSDNDSSSKLISGVYAKERIEDILMPWLRGSVCTL